MKREIVFWKNHFDDFINSLDDDSQQKVLWILKTLESLPKIPIKFFKHISGVAGLYEIRISWEGKAYRIFCFLIKGIKLFYVTALLKKIKRLRNKKY